MKILAHRDGINHHKDAINRPQDKRLIIVETAIHRVCCLNLWAKLLDITTQAR
ncbi:MAG: hypothetical protein V7L27_27870 [Nostoc sp.]|uniref:hypothetical protein n=1 Tax=Nostoc sp. TaxID=1180 RepID=UPI002FF8F33A